MSDANVHRLRIEVITESRARLLGLLRSSNWFIRGQPFTIVFKVKNLGNYTFTGGTFSPMVDYPTQQSTEIADIRLPTLEAGAEWTSEAFTLTALAEGAAFVIPQSIQADKTVQILDEKGEPCGGRNAIGVIHIETRRDFYTFFALMISVASLLILVLEKLVSLIAFLFRL